MIDKVDLFDCDAADTFILLEHYFTKYLIEDATNPAFGKVREYLATTFHPDSSAMKSLSYGDEDGSIEAQPVTDFDPDAEMPFAGLDAPLGG